MSSHKDAHNNDATMHEVKGFPSAALGYFYQKTLRGVSEWVRSSRLPNVISLENGYDAPPTEVNGDVYAIESPELTVSAIAWQSGTTVRFTFSAGYDSTLYATGSYLTISGEPTQTVHNGVWVITTVNAGYLDVTNSGVTSAANDVISGSSTGYVTHEDFDPENLANGQTIPRQGIVKYDSAVDLWFGNSFQEGDEYYDSSNGSKTSFNGTSLDVGSGIYSKKITLTAAQILAATSVDVEAAQSGYAWKVIAMDVDYTHVTTVYDVGLAITAQIETATNNQYATKGILGTATSVFVTAVPTSSTTTQLVNNKKLSVKADAASSTGDGTAIVYITYRKIKI